MKMLVCTNVSGASLLIWELTLQMAGKTLQSVANGESTRLLARLAELVDDILIDIVP